MDLKSRFPLANLRLRRAQNTSYQFLEKSGCQVVLEAIDNYFFHFQFHELLSENRTLKGRLMLQERAFRKMNSLQTGKLKKKKLANRRGRRISISKNTNEHLKTIFSFFRTISKVRVFFLLQEMANP